METNNCYNLPQLPYGYKDLEPYISEKQLQIHHQKHHQAYVTASNAILEKLAKARDKNTDLDIKSTLKELSFNLGGHILHSLFWFNLKPAGKTPNKPEESLLDAIIRDFCSFERFKKEFTQAAASVEGSGWAALVFDIEIKKLLIMQIEKHNTNIYPGAEILMVLDVFEHAYYLDYKNERSKYVEAFWNIVNWAEVNERYEFAKKSSI